MSNPKRVADDGVTTVDKPLSGGLAQPWGLAQSWGLASCVWAARQQRPGRK